jgi:type IV pilus assembly protein PilP
MNSRLIQILLPALLLTACSEGDMSDLQRFVADVKAREPSPIEPLPELKQIETFVYMPGERRSPFSQGEQATPEEIAEASNGIAPDPLRRKEELEQYPLDSIRMVGTLEQEADIWALLVIQDGTLFRVKAGNYLGQNHGQITRIAEEKIELTEIVPDGMNGWQERQANVALTE